MLVLYSLFGGIGERHSAGQGGRFPLAGVGSAHGFILLICAEPLAAPCQQRFKPRLRYHSHAQFGSFFIFA